MTSLTALIVLLLQAPPKPVALVVDPVADFEAWTGARLVFTRQEAPPQVLYATTPALSPERRIEAARILAAHARNYPQGLFGKVGLKTVAVFAGCGDPEGDGFRPWVEALDGYRYFGRWHTVGAIAACFYDDGQLPLTFHHEVFHHLDASRGGVTDYEHFLDDDDRFTAALDGNKRYAALELDATTIKALRDVSSGEVLEESVADYAQKSPGEDQAETARWLQTHLADGLLQAALRPELAGSQRILHLFKEYTAASPTLSVAWFVEVALAHLGSAQKKPPEPAIQQPCTNTWLAKVDAAIDDPDLRRAIRRVQPATVRIGNGSGVNIAAHGLILTAGHVSDDIGDRFTVAFADGRKFSGVTIASDTFLDLGLVRLEDAPDDLPFARLADAAPEVGDTVVVIGQPGSRTPEGELTHYEPWNVSVGQIRGFLPDRLGKQSLGRTKHSAWTYWGHSGSPLFDTHGRIVALHNSWDSRTAMRHAVTWEAIRVFLVDRARVMLSWSARMSTEAWRWGDLFELDVPLATEVRELDEMIELRFPEESDTPLLLAVFSPMATPGGPEQTVRDALERFAATRSFPHARPELSIDPHGVVAGRVSFVTDLAWEALAIGWNQHLVVAFSAAARPEAGIFDRAEALMASLQPGELVVPKDVVPEATGDF